MKIYGHEQQIRLVREAATGDRLAHSYLFYGMEGIGKKLVALELARSLVCPISAPLACGVCPSCKKALTGNHPDIFVFSTSSNSIKIDDVRMLQEKSALRPFEAPRKVFIINDADRMTREAANAFLKTLEEPPPSSVFFLITPRCHSLLPTVLSRCQKIGFSPLDKETLVSLLIEEHGCEKEKALTIASLSGGSVSLAQDMLGGNVMALRAALLGALKELVAVGEMGIFNFVKTVGSDKQEAQNNLEIIQSIFRDAASLRLNGGKASIINSDAVEIIETLAALLAPTVYVHIFREIDWALKALRANANRQLLLESTCHKIIGAMR